METESRGTKTARLKERPTAPEALVKDFPRILLPIRPPHPLAESKAVAAIPKGSGWLYEPKWDGFRCLAFRRGNRILLQSKAGQRLDRYFPEIVDALAALPQTRFVLDGEIVIFIGKRLSFDDLLMRIHPAESRIRKLSSDTPATYSCFDLLVDAQGKSLAPKPLVERRKQLQNFFTHAGRAGKDRVRISPASRNYEQAEKWMHNLTKLGLDGIVAKRLDEPYHSGERTGMVKIKRIRTADVVVGGFRYAEKGGGIGSLLLGLYDDKGALDHVGFTSSFSAVQRQELKQRLEPLISAPGFTGRAPGGPSRWSTKRSTEWQPLKPKLVAEVRFDHFSGGRFRHGAKFLRWRPEKKPRACTFDQL